MHRNEVDRLYALIDLAALLGQQSDFQEILRLITQKAADLVPAEMVLLMMINPQTRQTIKTVHREGRADEDKKYHLIHINIQ